MAYPANATFNHQEKSSRLWALFTILPVKVIALIPHFIIMYCLNIAMSGLAGAGLLLSLFTGKYPKMIADLIVGVQRWNWRIMAYFYCLSDKYPPFKLEPSDYPADLSFEYKEETSRLWAFLTIIPVKAVILIPHLVVMIVLSLIAVFCMVIGIPAALILGRYPKGFENWIVKLKRYQFRLVVYWFCLSDEYPPIGWN